MAEARHASFIETGKRFKPYSDYRDSGVEWWGQIPSHWRESKVKYLGRYINGYAFKPDDWSVDGNPIIRIQNLTNADATFNRFSGELDARYRVVRGDILISWSASLGLFIWREPEDGWLNQHIFKVVLREGFVDRSFFVWLGDWFIRELQKETHGSTMTHLTSGLFGAFRVELPPPEEQRAIALFLDAETARIDALVAKKEQLIKLLQEQRNAHIFNAVTKGLDPNVELRDSGVEWLGAIPAHWEVKKVKRLSLVRRGASPRPIDDPVYFDDEGEYAWVRIADVTASDRYLERTTQRLSSLGKSKSVALEPGELVVSIAATVGKPIITKIKCCIHDGFVYFVGLPASREFLFYVFSSGEPYKGLGKLGTQLNLNTDTIGDIYLPQPSISEQDAIVQFLDRETARIDALIFKIRNAIDRLQEFRTALISSAVTGKIDLRETTA
jgi:type I restriction enzyme, S subunit